MKDETAYQRDIIHAVEQLGGWGKKLSNRFLIGIPDLGITLRPFGTTIVEVKKVDHSPTNSRAAQTGLTELQAINLRDIWKSGGNCGVILISPGGSGGAVKTWAYPGPADTYTPREFHECHLLKTAKNPWVNLIPHLLQEMQNPGP